MNFEEGLVVELKSISGLTNTVFPAFAGQKVVPPHVIYTRNNYANGRTQDLQGHDGLITREYQIDIYETSLSDLTVLTELILAEIRTFQFTNIGTTGPYIQHCNITEDFYVYDEIVKYWRGIVTFLVTYRESN